MTSSCCARPWAVRRARFRDPWPRNGPTSGSPRPRGCCTPRCGRLGAIAYLVDENIEDGDSDPDNPPLRNYRWLYFAVRESKRSVRAWYTLMIPVADVDNAGMQALVRLMDGEIEAQRLVN